ncbi:MAG: hypothetical protein ABJB86_10615 [Bacteroidota bacterium]
MPVDVMVSSKAEKDIAESHVPGVNHYVVKPVSFNNFFKMIVDKYNTLSCKNHFNCYLIKPVEVDAFRLLSMK